MTRPRNIAGPQIRKLRSSRGLTQPMLVARVNLLGWGISRETLAKIESQFRWIADAELLCMARALEVPVTELLPAKEEDRRVIQNFFGKRKR